MRHDVKGAISRTLLALLTFLTWSSLAGAEPAPSYSVAYSAPAECPAQREFENALSSRAPGAALVPATAASIAFRVTLSRSATSVAGTLWIKLPGEPETRRDVADPSCSDAAASLVIMAALVLDGYLRQTNPPADALPVQAAVASVEADASSSHAEPPATARVSIAKVEAAPSPSPAPHADRPLPAAPAKPRTVTPGAFASATWESAVAPSSSLGLFTGAAVELRRAGIWAPSVRLGFLYMPWSTANVPAGSARFRLLSARLLGCPLRFGAVLAVRACAEFDAGSLEAEGRSIDNAEHHAMPWLAAGAAVRGEYAPLRTLTLEAGASVEGLVRSDEFVFRPNVVVYDVPAVSFGAVIGLLASLP